MGSESLKIQQDYYKIVARNSITLLVLDIFIFISITCLNLLPSIYDRVQNEYELTTITPIMINEAIFVMVAAGFAIFFGYLVDKVDKRTIMYTSLLLIISGLLMCTFAPTFFLFVLGRLITYLGIGAQLPANYSILGDIIPERYWSTLYASLALLTAFAGGVSNFLSGFLAPLNIWNLDWHFPFALLSILAGVTFVLISLIKLPTRGASSVENVDSNLGEKMRSGSIAYGYTINRNDLKPIWNLKSNKNAIISNFFFVIPASIMQAFLVYYLIKTPFASFPDAIRTQVSQIFAAMTAIGYILGTFTLGPVFDSFKEKKNSMELRAKYTYIGLAIATPMIIAAFFCITPVNYATLNLENVDPTDASLDFTKYAIILGEIFREYPVYTAYFVLLLLGGMMASPVSMNRPPTMLEVNLPEHEATGLSLVNFTDQMGKGAAMLFLSFQMIIFDKLFDLIDGRLIIAFSALFYIPAIIGWGRVAKNIKADIEQKNLVLKERARDIKDNIINDEEFTEEQMENEILRDSETSILE